MEKISMRNEKMKNYISSFSVTNFKAIRDSGTVRFTPFTAIIGNNGSGKSSLLEALLTYQPLANSKN